MFMLQRRPFLARPHQEHAHIAARARARVGCPAGEIEGDRTRRGRAWRGPRVGELEHGEMARGELKEAMVFGVAVAVGHHD